MNCKKDIIIIGASGGIGQYLVKYYHESCNIYGTFYSNVDDLFRSKNIHYYRVNVQNRGNISFFVDDIKSVLRNPVMIYTPAISINSLAHKYNDVDWDNTIAVNLTGAMDTTKCILPIMRELNYGRIIYLSSVLSKMAVVGTIAYTATKAALNAMVKVISKENAKKNITANSLVLGYYDIGIISKVPQNYLNETVIPSIPEGHLGNPVNITNAVDFIINSDFLSGASIDINGGMN
jgi:NAD(P)-dependent dehydrogenase (short-subunit alcohol dehydrogenase family)